MIIFQIWWRSVTICDQICRLMCDQIWYLLKYGVGNLINLTCGNDISDQYQYIPLTNIATPHHYLLENPKMSKITTIIYDIPWIFFKYFVTAYFCYFNSHNEYFYGTQHNSALYQANIASLHKGILFISGQFENLICRSTV